LIETDSPYLTPVPYRGKPNSPAYTYYVAEKLAEIRNTTIGEIAKLTTQNFNQLFFS
jgi:TatD DNase family protein